MGIDYRRLSKEYLETFIQMRITQLREEGAKEEIDLVPALRDYYDSEPMSIKWTPKVRLYAAPSA